MSKLKALIALISVVPYLLTGAGSNLRVLGLPQAAEATTPYGPAIFQIKVLASPAAVALQTSAEQSLTVTGLLVGDIVLTVNKPTQQAVGIHVGRVSAANTWKYSATNASTVAVTPTAAEVYDLLIFRPAL